MALSSAVPRPVQAAIAAALCGLAALAVLPAAAQTLPWRIAQFQAQTPDCESHPGYGWVGRVSGQSNTSWGSGSLPVSVIGCFPSEADCNVWRNRAIGLVNALLIQNSCRPRPVPGR